MEIQRDRKAGKLYLSQSRYIEKVLDRFNMGNFKAVSIPFAAHFRLSAESCPHSECMLWCALGQTCHML